MNGGLITKDTQSAVAVNAGSFTMTGGKITGNSADQGTGVYGWGGAKVRIDGGEIIGNSGQSGCRPLCARQAGHYRRQDL